MGWVLSVLVSAAALGGAHTPAGLTTVILAPAILLGPVAFVLLWFAANGRFLHFQSLREHVFDRIPWWLWYAHGMASLYGVTLIAAHTFEFLSADRAEAVVAGLVGVIYATAFVLLKVMSQASQCPNGHASGAFTQYCRECGAPLVNNL
jgi:hypothetical protein